MGEHRTTTGTRGVSKGPLIAVGTIIVVVLAVFGWFELRDRIADQGVQAAEACVEGPARLPVTADPDIASQITELATRFDATAPVVRDRCVTVQVTTVPSASVSNALIAGEASWDPATLGPVPALWIPRSSDSVAGLPIGTVEGTPKSLASTPIVLAGAPELTDALAEADTGWADLPALQSDGTALDRLGLPGWGGLRLQLPIGPDSDATISVLAAVAAAAAGAEDQPLVPDQVGQSSVVSALSALSTTDDGTSAVVPDSTDAALSRLAAGATAADSGVHAVPVTEQQLGTSGQTGLSAYSPPGSAVVADHPAVVLSGSGVDEAIASAAAQFVEFASRPENARVFTDAGYDAPRSSADVSVAPEVRSGLVDTVSNPATVRRSTILVDVSGSMDAVEGARTRLQNVSAALTTQFDRVLDSTDLGLWVYSKDLDGSRPYRTVVPTGQLAEQLPDGNRRQQLIAAVGSLQPASATSTYASVTAAYRSALEGYVPGRPNSLLLVTDGPNDDTSISSRQFLTDLADLIDAEAPVAIDVVSIGTNTDSRTLEAMSGITGGTFTIVDTSDGGELPEILRKLMY